MRLLNKPSCLDDSQTIDIVDEMEPKEFWSLFPDAEIDPNKSIERKSLMSPWNLRLVRYYFFSNSRLNFNSSPTVEVERTRRLKKTVGLKGFIKSEYYIALDMPYHPIVSSNEYHARYGDTQLFPRWSGLAYMSLYYPYIFSHRSYLFYYRARNLADFGLYAQYDGEGNNRFLNDFYRKEWEETRRRKNVRKWKYGWPDWMMYTWRDAYGYEWIRFEPDHHCLAGGPVFWLTKWYELTGEERYLNAAYNFLYYQVPRYGFHKGVWKGISYYWTGYDPGYPSFSNRRELPAAQDVTNNIQALVALGLASAGYHKGDKKMLEMARGLLWYLCRSFSIDGRWFYHGPENPLSKTKAVSHMGACIIPSMYALTYLYKAGMNVDYLAEGLEPAIKLYSTHWPDMKSREIPKPLKPLPLENLITSYKTMSTSTPKRSFNVSFATTFQVRLDDVREVAFSDKFPRGFELGGALILKVSVWRDGGWILIRKEEVEPKEISDGMKVLNRTDPCDIYRIEYGPLKSDISEFNVPPSIITVTTSSGKRIHKDSVTQQPEHNACVNSDNLLEIIALINFPKHPADIKAVTSEDFLNLLPRPLTEEEKARFSSPEAKDAVEKALEEYRKAEAAFRRGFLKNAEEHLETSLNLINEALLLDSQRSGFHGSTM